MSRLSRCSAIFRCLLGIALISWGGSSAALAGAVLALPPNAKTDLSAAEISTLKDGVMLTVKDRTLRDVLQAIQNSSGIPFSIADTLMEQPVTAPLRAPNWIR